LRNQKDYFRDIKPAAVTADALELAENLIKKMSAKLDLNKFEDSYEVAVKALVEAKINNLPVPIDEAPRKQPANVINLMDALRKSIGPDTRAGKKPPKSEKSSPQRRSRWSSPVPGASQHKPSRNDLLGALICGLTT
jgi:DNA end-binding protein Ku